MGVRSLPSPATRLIGREDDVALVASLLAAPTGRLVTITGPAGVGKTRVAIEVARRRATEGVDVAFVPLADLGDEAGVASRILDGLGLADTGSRPALDGILEAIGERAILLVIDNFEHLIEAASTVAAIIDAAPTVSVLLTSRRPLMTRAERCVRLEPLAVTSSADVTTESTSPAVTLLLDRLRAIDAQPTMTDDVADDLARICRRLDGIPLAIELAATRARSMPLHDLAEALEARVTLLNRGAPDAPVRQRTMTEAIAWSVGLLRPTSAAVFRRLAVCAGGATVELVAAIMSDVGLARAELLDALDDLVAHSLVSLDHAGRYQMLHVIRDVALGELNATDAHATRDRHSDYLLRLAEAARGPLLGPEQAVWLDRLQADSSNFSAAVRHAVSTGNSVLALRLCLALRFLWYVRGPLTEARALFSAALDLPNAPESLRAAVLSEAGALARHHGDLAAADELTANAVALATTSGDESLLAAALLQRGFVLHLLGRYDDARPVLERSLSINLARHDQLGVARASHHLGLVAFWGDGDSALAWDLHSRALALFRELDNERHIATVLIAMSELARSRGDLHAARRLGAEAHEHLRRLDDLPLVVYALHHAAAIAADEGHLTRAVRLLGASEGIEAASGAAPWPAVAEGASRWLPTAIRSLGVQRVDALRTGSRRLDPEAALALADGDSPDADPRLTRRENEVVMLVGEGLTNRAIADRLVVSERTIEGHVARILAKLGVRSRTQIAAWSSGQEG